MWGFKGSLAVPYKLGGDIDLIRLALDPKSTP